MISRWFGSRRRNKVELHVHMDGAVRLDTFRDVAQRRGIELPTRTPEGLARLVRVPHDCRDLTTFLKTFHFFIPIIQDPDAVERIAYEHCEDQARQGVLYFETRFSPHIFSREGFSPAEATERALAGLKRGGEDFDVGVRAILCCMRHEPAWSEEVVDLAIKHRNDGVCGIDLAGDETHFGAIEHAAAFQRAREHGLHRTVHAGEAGPAQNIREALHLLHAERIGHGYALVQDERLYKWVQDEDIPLECCITSSLQTGAVKSLDTHPVRRFAADRLNISLSTDDPSVSGIDLEHEHRLAFGDLGFSAAELTYMTFNAARTAFLPEDEKARLLARLKREYLPPGIE